MNWKIWIDTGGTFTDCIAVSPQGTWTRLKVLSTGCLRATLGEKIRPNRYAIFHHWTGPLPRLEGYVCRTLSSANSLGTVTQTNFREGWIELSENGAIPPHQAVEFSAGEEAPILAARIATQTALHEQLPPLDLRLGTTRGTNALLERKGAKVTLLTTKGFADLTRIGTQQRPDLFQLDIPEPKLLYDEVVEIQERLAADGTILEPLDLTLPIIPDPTRSYAIALLHSYRNPAHEQAIGTALREKGITHVSLSHELAPAIQLLPRTQTALVNAYLDPVLHTYLEGIRDRLAPDSSFFVMSSTGGLARAESYHAKDSILSGPAGGLAGAAQVARELGFAKLLTLDMGGTSTDTARYDGHYDYRFEIQVGGAHLHSPALSIETVAAGGGSICAFDGSRLTVGPESAGAHPGPACYGAGGPFTLTDVNLLLGKLDPELMGIPIDRIAARQALEEIREAIKTRAGITYSELELLHGWEQIANEKMAEAIRKISVSKGFDPSEYPLLAFGGAGGLHACAIAELLHIDTLILPFDSGLLSAFGIGHAPVQRLATKQILQMLEAWEGQLPNAFSQLEKNAIAFVRKDLGASSTVEITERQVYLRLKGQDHSLNLAWTPGTSLAESFEKAYRDLFGHYPAAPRIEIEKIHVLAAERLPLATAVVDALFDEKQPALAIPVLKWPEIVVGSRFSGPSVVVHPQATAYLAPGWELEMRANRHLVFHRKNKPEKKERTFKEHIELELFFNRFTAIAEEMGAQLQRTSFSVNIKERLDFSCALLDANGYLLVNAPHIPVHLGSLGICTRAVCKALPLNPGDVAITNHPGFGGSHLPDITLIGAVFDEEGRLIGYVANRAHHSEIGGKRPGSMPPDAQNLSEEGVVFPPMYLVKGGVAQWETIEAQLTKGPYPTRALSENLADLNAALSSLKTGEQKLITLARQFGVEKLTYYMQRIKESAADAAREAFQQLGNRAVTARERLDDGHVIHVSMEIQEGQVRFDFSGTSPVHPGNLNANQAIVYSTLLYVLRVLCKRPVALNEGLLEQVSVSLPESFLNPHFPDAPENCPAVVGGNTEVSQRLTDTLLKALHLAACSQGTMNNFLFGNARFGYYETIGGGVGAGPGFHGRSGVHQHMTNTKITDPEILEYRYPVRLHRFAIRRGSGGDGQWRGGDGIIREFEFLEKVEMTLLSQHRVEAPYGLEGGKSGKCGAQHLIRKDSLQEPMEGIDSRDLEAGDRVVIETPGGGGWGHP
ncbi:MAG: hydantoinase B/oxoprolinase family protein [Saprospirales bacterium]|nr:hydantoinase B/oxoprolinase family protein [Saprospirales bacterium]